MMETCLDLPVPFCLMCDLGGASQQHRFENTRCAWAGGTCANYPVFFLESSRVIYCVTLAYVLVFEEFLIHDSRGFTVLKNN